ncbi:hypothetical protein PFISCL1PPCAC_18587, partial [Pristionchus fissidentatus]
LQKLILIFIYKCSVVSCQCNGGIPSEEVKGFLDDHNKLRSTISAGNYVAKGNKMPAPKSPIANMTWDCEIEKSAQAVSDTCVNEHSSNRGNLGENLYQAWSSRKLTLTGSGEKSSNYWENEFQEHGWPGVKLTREIFDSGIGHATQV